MIWLFDRGGEHLRYEICHDEKGCGYLMVLTSPTGQKRVERVHEPTKLIERSVDQLKRLRDDGWKVG